MAQKLVTTFVLLLFILLVIAGLSVLSASNGDIAANIHQETILFLALPVTTGSLAARCDISSSSEESHPRT